MTLVSTTPLPVPVRPQSAVRELQPNEQAVAIEVQGAVSSSN